MISQSDPRRRSRGEPSPPLLPASPLPSSGPQRLCFPCRAPLVLRSGTASWLRCSLRRQPLAALLLWEPRPAARYHYPLHPMLRHILPLRAPPPLAPQRVAAAASTGQCATAASHALGSSPSCVPSILEDLALATRARSASLAAHAREQRSWTREGTGRSGGVMSLVG